MAEETVFSDDPEAMAVKWFDQGAERLHLVDLDGASRGQPVNKGVIGRIVRAVPIPVQLGGGIRDMSVLETYFSLELRYVILGTAAHRDPEFVEMACRAFPGRIILGIDARGDRVAVEGWTEDTESTPVELVGRYEGQGIAAVVYTDIHRDGMRTGPNVDATRAMAEATEIPVIASGGISDLSDVQRVMSLSGAGVMGMITGRAIYDGSLDLSQAIKMTKA
jgi:phosphoribosylformimino-5-aminoimidazole carboxamide ribotide isomerase